MYAIRSYYASARFAVGQGRGLRGDDFADPLLRQSQHAIKLLAGIGVALGRTLHLDEATCIVPICCSNLAGSKAKYPKANCRKR